MRKLFWRISFVARLSWIEQDFRLVKLKFNWKISGWPVHQRRGLTPRQAVLWEIGGHEALEANR